MITVFNRRELITLSSQQKLFAVRQALWDADIDSQTGIPGMLGFGDRQFIEMPGVNYDALYTYIVYVYKKDLHRAVEVLQSVQQHW